MCCVYVQTTIYILGAVELSNVRNPLPGRASYSNITTKVGTSKQESQVTATRNCPGTSNIMCSVITNCLLTIIISVLGVHDTEYYQEELQYMVIHV